MTGLSAQALAGASLAVRGTANAHQAGLERVEGMICIRVTTPPEDGRANEAARAALAASLNAATSRLTPKRGATLRQKVFRPDQPGAFSSR